MMGSIIRKAKEYFSAKIGEGCFEETGFYPYLCCTEGLPCKGLKMFLPIVTESILFASSVQFDKLESDFIELHATHSY